MRSPPGLFWLLLAALSPAPFPAILPQCQAADISDVLGSLEQALADNPDLIAAAAASRPPLKPPPYSTVHGPRPRPRDIKLGPPRTPGFARQIKPWGDGFVRMPVQRHTFNGTRHFRTSRVRRPNKPTYPPSGGANGSATTTTPITQRRSRRAADANSPPQNAAPAGAPIQPGWTWSHLDDFEGTWYMIELDIGTPPQRVMVMIDTGSYELWVNPLCINSDDPVLCGTYGHYYPQLSNTSSTVAGAFKVNYGTGSAQGLYYSDSIRLSMFQVPGVQFAVANSTSITYSGVLGLGYTWPFTTKYPTLLSLMWALGFIAAPVFSMGLGGEGDGYSEIIFGGVNRFKFTGSLEPVSIWPPIDKQDPAWIQYWLNVTSIGMTPPNQVPRVYTSTVFNMPMLIDSGSTLSYVREDIVKVFGQQLNATVDSEGSYIVDCALRNQNGTIDFGFNHGKMVVTVRYKDFIWEASRGLCLMGFQPADAGNTNYVLGDTFIRGAYLVFDQQSDVVWVADYYNCGDGVAMVGEKQADTQYVVGQC